MESANRRVVLILAPVYWPGFKSGGPVRTIRNLVTSLNDQFDFRVVTADRDRGELRPYDKVVVNQWNEIDGARVFYADRAAMQPRALRRLVNAVGPDVVYVNSFFDPVFSIRPLVMRWLRLLAPQARWVLAPRGEFAASALTIKRWKKLPYLFVSRLLGIHRDLVWQASSEFESADIQRVIHPGDDRIVIAPDLTAPVPQELPHPPERHPGSALEVCFLARIAPMKNLDFALEAVKRVRRPVRFHVYGPVADQSYWDQCRSLLPPEGGNVEVFIHGEIQHPDVRDMLAKHDLFFLPTRGENFGHVIFEALAAGVPVLISDRTPWRDLEARGVGWVRPLDDTRAFADIISRCADLSPEERAAMSVRAHEYAIEMSRSSEVIARNVALFMR